MTNINPFIKPAYLLMNSLSYRGKFAIIASLFAIPLLLLGGRSAWESHESIDLAHQNQQGIIYIKDATKLIQKMEDLRDTATLNFFNVNQGFFDIYQQNKMKVQQTISALKGNKNYLNKHQDFLDQIFLDITKNKIRPGYEAAEITSVYDNATILVEKVYQWRLKLLHEHISLPATTPNVISIVDIINKSGKLFQSLGETRTYGSYYLAKEFVAATGTQTLNKNYNILTEHLSHLQVEAPKHAKQFTTLIDSNIFLNHIEAVDHSRNLLDEKLIQAISPDGSPTKFYQAVSDDISKIYSSVFVLIDTADQLLAKAHNTSQRKLALFHSSVAVIIVLLIYLYMGLFTNFRITFQRLIRSANKVACGDYSKPITLRTNDETLQLSKAMDNMRIKLKAREEELKLLSQTDGLSQLKNRKYFDEALPIALASSCRNHTFMSLVLMDIDHFKKVNDTYGHQAGDECIKQVAALMLKNFKRKTDVVARFGGEEFVTILYGLKMNEAIEQTETLRKSIEEFTIDTKNEQLKVTASFGVASVTPGSNFIYEDIVSAVDEQLYASKKQGRNRVSSILLDNFNPQNTVMT